MASFLRGKQAGIQKDLSDGILPGLFALDDQARYGINSQISCLAYDPIQSLLAVGTNETTSGSGQIYVFGQSRVRVTFTLPRRASIRILQFCANRLISVDSKNEVIVWDLQEARKIASYAPPGAVTALVTDHMLDWAFIGLQNGGVIVYDLDRERPAPLKLPNFWQERSPRSHMLSVVSMQLHPKDIGQLLIGYTEGAIIYSFKQNRPIKYFQYEIPPGAPGGNSDPTGINEIRRPRLTQVLWHPSGTFLATAHEDSSLVFWDLADGRVLMSRTLQDTRVNQPTGRGVSSPTRGTFSFKESYKRIAWCCKDNPDDTGLLIAGGFSASSPDAGLTFIDLGPTPVYATSSWQVLSSHFEGKKKHILPTPHGVELVDFCLIPRTTPHFAGAHDPIAAICLLSSGELITLSFPSGHPISPTNQLHPSLFFVHPFVTSFAVSAVERGRWLGMTETRNAGPRICQGGAEAAHPLRRYEARNIVQVANGDGTVRIWDAGHEDEIENPTALQIDVARAVARFSDVDITKMSMGDATGEFAVGTKAGEVVIYRWGGNKLYGRESARPLDIKPGDVVDIADRTEPTLKEGLQPFVLYNMAQGPITALKMSDVGFVGVGSAGGMFSIIDLRGPAVIYSAAVSDFIKAEKQSSFIKKAPRVQTGKADWPVAIEFGVMTVDGDDYSSILCFVGTDAGYVATFKILPQSSGRYTAELAGSSLCNGSVVSLSPIKESGKPASASGMVVAGLREGQQVIGTLVVVTNSEARIFKPAFSKGAHKTWDDFTCLSASVTHFELHGYALVGIFNDGTTRAYSIPGLKEIGVSSITALDRNRTSSAIVTHSGDIFGFTGPSEFAMMNVWGTGQSLPISQDKLFNPQATIPPRPTISNLQWIAGTQHVSPTDLDILIGGPDRPPSKRMLEATAMEERDARASGGPSRTGTSASQEGWGDYMTRQLNERTEKLNIVGESMERVQENSAGYASDVSKYLGKQKRNMVLKGLAGKFF